LGHLIPELLDQETKSTADFIAIRLRYWNGAISVRQDRTLGAIKHPLYPPSVITSVPALAKHCHKWAAFWLLLAGSCRFSYTEVTEGSAEQAPGAEVASGGKAW
jgi:hypothetical protein